MPAAIAFICLISLSICIVVAIGGKNRVIGNNNKLPWNIPEDLKRFKDITSGHPIIMGRKTYESIGRALPNRTNIIVTRDTNYQAAGCIVVNTLDDAINQAKQVETDQICIIGGGEIFRQAMPIVDKLYLTTIEGEFEGNVFFPEYKEFSKVINKSLHESNGYKYTFLDLEKS